MMDDHLNSFHIGSKYGSAHRVADTMVYVFVFAAGITLADTIKDEMRQSLSPSYSNFAIGIATMIILVIMCVLVIYVTYNLFSSEELYYLRAKSEQITKQELLDAKLKYWKQQHKQY